MILETIAEATRKRVAAEKEKCSFAEMKEKATAMNPDTGFPFEQALKKPGMSFICEVKKASPSKGIIAEDFPYLEIAKEYEAAGASAISCLTEPEYFKGDKRYLKKIAETVSIPVLRKDFTVDPYMIYEAKVLGATAVLLICALLPEETLKEYLETAHSLGLSALVEAHDEAEVAQAMRAGARIIGVNNRNLKDFTVDIHNSERLRELVPENIVFVSESGIKTPEDVGRLYQNKTDAVLIGETLMRSSNKKAELEKLSSMCAKQNRAHGESNVMEEQTRIKICGLTRLEDIDAVNELKPEYVGFVFAKSRRQITKEHAVTLRRYLDSEIQAVGVFVNELPAIVAGYLEEGVIDLAQLHGNESEEYIHSLRFRTGGELIKAFSIKTREDVEKAKKSSADYILLDHGKGGTGESFDWSLIRNMDRPYFLAGGLNAENVEQAILQTHPFAVDISSGVETDGVKDPKKITECIRRIRHV